MKPGAMIKDIATSLLQRPVTERYPAVRRPTPERLRGCLRWDSAACTGCGLCALDCPAKAIDVTVVDKKAKDFAFTYHLDRCTFCAQCVSSCRQGCLSMRADDWELAALTRNAFTLEQRSDGSRQEGRDDEDDESETA